jgi:hypothetical protein
MKTTFKIKLLFLCLYLLPNLHAQVNIGTVELPADGAMLQLKSITGATSGGKNAEEGLLLPRVALISHTSLEPAVTGATDEEMKEHTGLVVYNLTEDTYLTKGLAVWNGTQWSCIRNQEMTAGIGMDVKKNLYSATQPNPNNSVVFHSIEVSMKPSTNIDYYGTPQFRVADLYKPTGGETRIYEYQISQYWNMEVNKDGDGDEYSNHVFPKDFNASSYSIYAILDPNGTGSMSPLERNEVWMYDETDNTIFHIQFFVMGEDTSSAMKTYAILVEQF